MGLTNPQTITLLQTGDLVEGQYAVSVISCIKLIIRHQQVLDLIIGSMQLMAPSVPSKEETIHSKCVFSASPRALRLNYHNRTGFTLTLCQAASRVR